MAAFQARPVSRAGLSEVTVGGGVRGHDCPFEVALFVLLHILCYKSFPKWHLA